MNSRFRSHGCGLMCLCVMTSYLVAGAGSSPAADAPAEPPLIKIMPLGDSITESGSGHPGYRYFLWQRLAADGLRADFVGSKVSRPEERFDPSTFDGDHEGHSGWRTDQILAWISSWTSVARPDIVLLHLGHNDLWHGKGPTNTLQDLAGILDHIRTVNPHVAILIGEIIPSTSIPIETTAELNAGITALARASSTAVSPVVAVDHSTGFQAETMTRDGTHPNDEGERHMADRWYAALRPILIEKEATLGEGGNDVYDRRRSRNR